MKKIIIKFKGDLFDINITKILAYPDNVYLIEYPNKSVLSSIIQPPIYIIEKENILSFQDEANLKYIDLLHSISQGIEENSHLF